MQVSTVSTACQTEDLPSKDHADGKADGKKRRKKKPGAFWLWAAAVLLLSVYLSRVSEAVRMVTSLVAHAQAGWQLLLPTQSRARA